MSIIRVLLLSLEDFVLQPYNEEHFFRWGYLYANKCVEKIGYGYAFQFSSVQLLSHVRFFVTPWTAAPQAFLTITNSQSLFKLMSIK